ncbi:MAG: toll/interleukin-1 receptor domain-containing protein [Chloroflexota bacterium]|nr:toll/interleukin-1 receptor domain-containing protein [Chloroflexota bacterium]
MPQSPEPVVFVSYSHDSPAHKEWVLRLASTLRSRGVDAILDQWDLVAGQDTVAFMEGSIARSDRVLLICTEPYVVRADTGSGGVGYERLVVTGELVEKIDTKKFIPVVRQTGMPRKLPHFLGSRLYIDCSSDEHFDKCLEELTREIHGVPRSTKPALGPNPFAAPAPERSSSRAVSLSGTARSGESILKERWFNDQYGIAEPGLSKLGRKGAMEIRSALHEPIAKSQLELLNAVRKAEIRTFGWPIGIILENREEYRPRPITEGVVAEVAISEKSLSGKPSYDYWMARNNGDFYLLQTLFEDERAESVLFFDTRIVRVTEAFLFLAGFYETLGAAPESRVTVGIAHHGLQGRTLTSAGQRHVFPRTTTALRSESQISDTEAGLRANLTDHVMRVLEPMFMLFDFTTFARPIYEDIVTKFSSGHVA